MAITPVHSDPARASELQYPPGISVSSTDTLFFMSGATAIPLYHMHPHIDEECALPDDIQEQTRWVMRTILEVLEFNGLSWKNVIHVYEFLTDMRDADLIHATMGEFLAGTNWYPADTMIGVNTLSAPGARFELDVIAARAID